MKKYIFIFIFFISSYTIFAEQNMNDLLGRWSFMHRRNYGYEFRFLNNYRAYCILYSGSNALVFKGIYTIEKDKLRINISEMKNERNVYRINLRNKFVRTSSSYFIFDADVQRSGKNTVLKLKTIKTIIDGSDSNGYFEPEIVLKKRK